MMLDGRQIESCIPPSQLIEAIGETLFVSNSCKSESDNPRVGSHPGESRNVDWMRNSCYDIVLLTTVTVLLVVFIVAA